MLKVSFENGGLLQRLTGLIARAERIAPKVFQDIGQMLVESIMMNFEVGGRPVSWAPLKPATILRKGNAQPLIESGALMNSVRISAFGEDFVEVIAGEGLPYARIHEFGGVIDHPGSEKFQVFQVDGNTIFTHGTKPHTITIPARRYFRIQDEDVIAIKEYLAGYLIQSRTNIQVT